MRLQMPLPTITVTAVVVAALVSLVRGTPLPCPEAKVDLILNGKLNPDVCCSYGICKSDVVIKTDR